MRKNLHDGPDGGSCPKFLLYRGGMGQIWAECFGRNPSDMKPADSYAIAALMTQVPGWRKAEKRMPMPLYGRQRGYERIPDAPDFLM